MMKRETFELLKRIAVFYDQFVVNQEKVNLWHEVLKGHTFDEIHGNLLAFVEGAAFPPKVSDLLLKSTNPKTIPNAEETMKLTSMLKPASEIVVQRELAKMRAILGIERGAKDARA
ncbi:replicative helicase loader/inhibitor [Neobacillus jeddahensis]|uniref:replicative helicase loader/inhibitor n=1 Tax=Neobacillus jeddahensis TaxID=1461580 RepID=UPI00058E2C57|nr:replicative helicase loader/inhibitor [Neobacillus jeddahensis]